MFELLDKVKPWMLITLMAVLTVVFVIGICFQAYYATERVVCDEQECITTMETRWDSMTETLQTRPVTHCNCVLSHEECRCFHTDPWDQTCPADCPAEDFRFDMSYKVYKL